MFRSLLPLLGPLCLLLHVAGGDGQVLCLLTHCSKALIQCQGDPICRTWMACTRACDDAIACQIRCGDLFSNDAINKFSECLISDHHCVPQRHTMCPRPAAGAVQPGFPLEALQGHWFITGGWNPLFDCFDCQSHTFTVDRSASPHRLRGALNFWVKKDLDCRGKNCSYVHRHVDQSWVQDPATPGHLINHGNEYLHYADDWFVLSASDRHVLVYYCGCNDAWCGYSGAILYTRSAVLPPAVIRPVSQALVAANIPNLTFDRFCHPDATVAGCV
eukprot:EG_transcript_15029